MTDWLSMIPIFLVRSDAVVLLIQVVLALVNTEQLDDVNASILMLSESLTYNSSQARVPEIKSCRSAIV